MNEFLTQVVANILAKQEGDILHALLDLHGRLLIICHHVWVMPHRIYHPVYVSKLRLQGRKFFNVGFYFQKLLDDERALFFGAEQICFMPC